MHNKQTIGLDSIPSNLAIDLTDELSERVTGGYDREISQTSEVERMIEELLKVELFPMQLDVKEKLKIN